MLLIALLAAPDPAAPVVSAAEVALPEIAVPALEARARFLMGTRLELRLEESVGEEVFERAFAEVARLEDILSNWRGESEISRLNRAAASEPMACSPELYAAVEAALRFAAETAGAFDPTVEPLVRALGLREDDGRLPGPGEPGEPPGAVRAGAGRPTIGWRHVRLDPDRRTVAFDRPGTGIDLGGIGKGIALDAAARILIRGGVRSALLDFGGQILALGAPAGSSGWPVGIVDPGDRDRAQSWITVRDASVSTSGNDQRAIEGVGERIGHILDPRRRAPAAWEGSVTVVARDATTADALSTGLFVLGPDRGLLWAEARGLPVLYVRRLPGGGIERRATSLFETLPQGGFSWNGMERKPQ